MPDTITILAEKIGTLTLEGGVEVKIVQVEGGGMRLFFDRPLAYCQDCVTFEGDEEEEGGEDAAGPVRRAFRRGPPPSVRMAIKKRERDKLAAMSGGMFD
jgi:hypothetical protein